MRLLALNGSVRGDQGDCADALDAALEPALGFAGDVDVSRVTLAGFRGTVEDMVDDLRAADAFLVATGTYWGSWGSPLQRFLEVVTPLEASDIFLGKPVACVVTMDSAGGVEVGTRLLGTFALLGCQVPPFPLVVLSRTATAVDGRPGFDDVWQERDLEVLVHNLKVAAAAGRSERSRFRAWSVDKGRLPSGPWPATGALDIGLPKRKP